MPLYRELSPNHFRAEYPILVNEGDGSVLVYVPGGEFEMGDDGDPGCAKSDLVLTTPEVSGFQFE